MIARPSRDRHPGRPRPLRPASGSRSGGIPDGARHGPAADDPSMDAPPIEPPTGPDRPRIPRSRPPARCLRAPAPAWRAAPTSACWVEWRAGSAEYLGVDVLLVRLGFVVTAFFGGLGVIAYLLGWIVLPGRTVGDGGTADRRPSSSCSATGWSRSGCSAIGGPIRVVASTGTARSGRSCSSVSAPRSCGCAPATSRTAPPAARAALPPLPVADRRRTSERHHRAAPDRSRRRARRPDRASPPRPRSYLGALTWSLLLVLAGGAWLLDAAGRRSTWISAWCSRWRWRSSAPRSS